MFVFFLLFIFLMVLCEEWIEMKEGSKLRRKKHRLCVRWKRNKWRANEGCYWLLRECMNMWRCWFMEKQVVLWYGHKVVVVVWVAGVFWLWGERLCGLKKKIGGRVLRDGIHILWIAFFWFCFYVSSSISSNNQWKSSIVYFNIFLWLKAL